MQVEGLEKAIEAVEFCPGMSNRDALFNKTFAQSKQSQIDWLIRVSTDVFGSLISTPEARAVLSCLKRSCSDSSLDSEYTNSDAYPLWPRIIALAIKTIPLSGAKTTATRTLQQMGPDGKVLSSNRPFKKIGDLTQPHRRGSMLNLEKSWNNSSKKKNSRKSFGNVFAAAAEEDARRAELENQLLQNYSYNGPGQGGGGGEAGRSGVQFFDDGAPQPSEETKKVSECYVPSYMGGWTTATDRFILKCFVFYCIYFCK